MPVQCPACKTFNEDLAAFCKQCGSSLRIDGKSEDHSKDQLKLKKDEGQEFTSLQGVSRDQERRLVPRVGGKTSWKVKVGFLVFLIVFTFLVFAFLVDRRVFRQGTPPEFLIVLLLSAAFWWPLFARTFGASAYRGIVTNLRHWTTDRTPDQKKKTKPKDWVFDLRLTDEKWEPKKDKRGFLIPVLEVAFTSGTLHGAALEEGNTVVVKGQKRKNELRVKEIWNLSPGDEIQRVGQKSEFYGLVSGMQRTQSKDLHFPDQNRFLDVWFFRLQRTDEQFQTVLKDDRGNLAPALPVEIRAQMISGPLQDGDKVRVRGQIVKGTLLTHEVLNCSSPGGASLTVKGWTGIA